VGWVRQHVRIADVVRRLFVYQNLSVKFTKLSPNASRLQIEDFSGCGFLLLSDTFYKFSKRIAKSVTFQISDFTEFKTQFAKFSV
jgi:hypothetical protein